MDTSEYLAFLREPYQQTEEERDWTNREFIRWGELRARQLGLPMDELYRGFVEDEIDRRVETERSFIEYLVKPFKNFLPEKDRVAVSDVPVTLLPIRAVNAHTIRAPSGDPIVMLNKGTFLMASLYTETQMSVEAVKRRYGDDAAADYMLRQYITILKYFRANGQIGLPEELVEIPFETHLIGNAVAIAMELFVTAHELGHVVAGHLTDGSLAVCKNVLPHNEEASIEFFEKSWKQEYEADSIGWHWYQQTWRKMPLLSRFLPAGEVAPLYFFELVALIEKNIESPDVYSHPPGSDRLEKLLGDLSSSAPVEVLNLGERSRTTAKTMPRFDGDYRLIGID